MHHLSADNKIAYTFWILALMGHWCFWHGMHTVPMFIHMTQLHIQKYIFTLVLLPFIQWNLNRSDDYFLFLSSDTKIVLITKPKSWCCHFINVQILLNVRGNINPFAQKCRPWSTHNMWFKMTKWAKVVTNYMCSNDSHLNYCLIQSSHSI